MQTESEDMLAVLDDRIVGIPEIAEVVGVSVVTMRKMVRAGANGIPVRMVSGRWWASRRNLEQWVRDQLMSPAQADAEIEAIGAELIRKAEEQLERSIAARREEAEIIRDDGPRFFLMENAPRWLE